MEIFTLSQVSQDAAAQALRAAGLTDPAQQFTPESLAASGQAFQLTTAGGTGVFVAEKRGTHLWIHGAGGVQTKGLTAAGFEVIEALARQADCDFVAFETARPGLSRLAKKTGFKVSAMVMKKKVR